MQVVGDIQSGQTVRLMSPYLEAARGIYTVVYIYRNGWLGVVAHSGRRHYDVPGHLCRQVDTAASSLTRRSDRSL